MFFTSNIFDFRRTERDIVINVKTSSCKVPVILQMLMELEFSRQIFGKKAQIANFMKTYSVGAELFHADRQT